MTTDAPIRDVAVQAPDSIILQAPAGSGKTTILVQRLLVLLTRVQRPEQVLAITFTRKAAAEMRERTLAALAHASGALPLPADPSPSLLSTIDLARATLQHGERLGWNLVTHPARLRIQTIEALNRWIGAQLPASASTPASETAERPFALYRDAARRALLEAASVPKGDQALRTLLDLFNNRWSRLEDQLATFLAFRHRWLRLIAPSQRAGLVDRVNASLERLLRERLEAAHAWFGADFLGRVAPVLRATARERNLAGDRDAGWLAWRDLEHELAPEPARVACWRALPAFFLTQQGTLRKKFQSQRGLPAVAENYRALARELCDELAERPGAVEWLKSLSQLPDAALGPDHAARLEALSAFLPLAAAVLATEMSARGVTDLVAISGNAREALVADAEPTELALRLGDSLQHILVDEFQDTSIEQRDLLQTLTSDWIAGDGRSLFVVGDPMQSIYRFRDAEVALFLHAQQHGIGAIHLRPLHLRANFRSGPQLVEFFNRCFAQLLPAQDEPREGAAAFRPAQSGREVGPPGSVHFHLLGCAARASQRAVERDRIVQIVRDIRMRDATGRVGILTQTRPQVAGLLPYLQSRGLPARGVQLVPLVELPVIQDLMALTRALLDPMDRVAWLAVLRAPWCGASLSALERIAVLAGAEGPIIEVLLSPQHDTELEPVVPRLSVVRAVLARAAAAVAANGIALAVERAWQSLGGPACLGQGGIVADVEHYLQRLHQAAARRDWRGAESVATFADDLFAEPGADQGLDVMTIHETKGLEFDHVVIVGLGQQLRSDHQPLLDWLEWPGSGTQASDLVVASRPPAGVNDDGVYHWLGNEHRRRQRAERLRLMYVAATRARTSLHWVACLSHDAVAGFGNPPANTALALLWPASQADFLAAGTTPATVLDPALPMDAPGEPVSPTIQRLRRDWQAPAPLALLDTLVHAPEHRGRAEEPEFHWAGVESRHVGSVLHQALQQLAESARANGTLPPSFDDSAFWSAQLRALGVARHRIPQGLHVIRQALVSMLGDATGRWILDPAHTPAHCEEPLTALIDGRLVSVVLDRHFVDAKGEHWIIDYKSGGHEGADLAGFLGNERERYRAQIELYGRVLAARLDGTPRIRAALYFPRLQEIVHYE